MFPISVSVKPKSQSSVRDNRLNEIEPSPFSFVDIVQTFGFRKGTAIHMKFCNEFQARTPSVGDLWGMGSQSLLQSQFTANRETGPGF